MMSTVMMRGRREAKACSEESEETDEWCYFFIFYSFLHSKITAPRGAAYIYLYFEFIVPILSK
jgi:hypothetical protein